MFEGESEGLKAIATTQSLRVPQSLGVLPSARGCGAVLMMEFLDMHPLTSFSQQMGTNLAKYAELVRKYRVSITITIFCRSLHLHNKHLLQRQLKSAGLVSGKEQIIEAVEQFGFHVPTCCGYLAMDNSWNSDWPVK
jgi:protein-ribulosamine 3-kinase